MVRSFRDTAGCETFIRGEQLDLLSLREAARILRAAFPQPEAEEALEGDDLIRAYADGRRVVTAETAWSDITPLVNALRAHGIDYFAPDPQNVTQPQCSSIGPMQRRATRLLWATDLTAPFARPARKPCTSSFQTRLQLEPPSYYKSALRGHCMTVSKHYTDAVFTGYSLQQAYKNSPKWVVSGYDQDGDETELFTINSEGAARGKLHKITGDVVWLLQSGNERRATPQSSFIQTLKKELDEAVDSLASARQGVEDNPEDLKWPGIEDGSSISSAP